VEEGGGGGGGYLAHLLPRQRIAVLSTPGAHSSETQVQGFIPPAVKLVAGATPPLRGQLGRYLPRNPPISTSSQTLPLEKEESFPQGFMPRCMTKPCMYMCAWICNTSKAASVSVAGEAAACD